MGLSSSKHELRLKGVGRMQGSGFRVRGSSFRVRGLGCRVDGP